MRRLPGYNCMICLLRDAEGKAGEGAHVGTGRLRYLKPERQSPTESKEPSQRFIFAGEQSYRILTLFSMIPVIICDIVMECRHKLKVKTPDT